jgi:3-keto-5-aminohexanoate cleavage enzyme
MMIGLTVSVRLRMSSHDAHYAGELVDGARMLGLFGDLATELLIRLDGDEGLFRAYENVEFLAPVLAGDYIEATAELVAMGGTSRKMKFEARKVVSNVRQEGVPASQANVLAVPITVCRAVGTCVTPKPLQRKLLEPKPLILTAAIVGAEVTRAQTPHVPFTPQEVADEAARCVLAGASVIHLHARNDDGSNTQSRERFQVLIDAIRKKTDCVIQTTTGGAVGMSIEERAGPLGCKPEMATLNCGSVNFGDDAFVNTRPDIRKLAAAIAGAKSVPELECYEIGHLEEALALHKEGLLTGTMHVQFVLGVTGGLGANEENLRFAISRLPAQSTWGVAGVGRHQKPMTELAMRLGGHARVGIEDNIYLSKGVLSEGSAPLVLQAAAYAKSIGRPIATVQQARAMLLNS